MGTTPPTANHAADIAAAPLHAAVAAPLATLEEQLAELETQLAALDNRRKALKRASTFDLDRWRALDAEEEALKRKREALLRAAAQAPEQVEASGADESAPSANGTPPTQTASSLTPMVAEAASATTNGAQPPPDAAREDGAGEDASTADKTTGDDGTSEQAQDKAEKEHGAPPPPLVPPGWTVANDTLSRTSGTNGTTSTAVGPVLWITGTVERDGGERELRVEWAGGRATLTARAMSDNRHLTGLASRGFPIREDRRRDYAEWLYDFYRANETILPFERHTSRLGWHGHIFVWPDAVMAAAGADTSRIRFTPRDSEAARIAGAINTRRGTLEGWLNAIRPDYERFPNFAATLCTAFASLLLEPLGMTEGFVGDVNEETQVGKTSELRVCVSAYGDAGGDDRLLTSWGSTKAGLEYRAGTLGSIPLLLDESRERRTASIVPTIYMLRNGHADDRATPGGAADKVSWKNTTLSTGEASLVEYVSAAGGALPGMPFGEKSPERARSVTKLVQEANANCGHAARDFVRRLVAGEFGTFAELRAEYERRFTVLLDQGYESRLAEHIALITLTADLLHRAFGLQAPSFTSLWSTAKDVSGKPGDEQAALDALVSIVAANRDLIFGLGDRERRLWGEELGIYRNGKLALHPDKTKRLLEDRDRRFDYPAAHRAWVRAGLLERDGKNLDPKVQCGKMRVRMLRFSAAATRDVFGIGQEENQ